ncbi:30S ribosomal protein S4 [Candidatus Berkiella aquae]|uniref:Small ribosomal subunit protein uS4 n=1 Tax=Candidatus Berkiella aquae TaxID=295108 RepID=A0A0Q9YBL3_9GAMM|nr:30S ribosomal protein S4 [Candidatus Berkiella aquae]MCS5710288.1 30S ribosomal protein S4 [Candidatus Berkiella aquae]
MARYIGPTCVLSRRYGKDLEFKTRPIESKCKKDTRPGQHGATRKRETTHGLQLTEKQALKFKYCLLERQFRKLFKEAARRKAATGVLLLQMLESRLDNVVFRMGFAATRKEARQLVSHKAIFVNGSCVNVPSYQVQPTDVISIRERAREQVRILDALKQAEDRGWVDWVQVDAKKLSGEFKRVPDRDELPSDINEQLVVELYSK